MALDKERERYFIMVKLVTIKKGKINRLSIVKLVEIWDNKVPNHQFGYPSAWHAMILLVDNSDRIASGAA